METLVSYWSYSIRRTSPGAAVYFVVFVSLKQQEVCIYRHFDVQVRIWARKWVKGGKSNVPLGIVRSPLI